MKIVLLAALLAIGIFGCSNKEAEEKKRKAQMYDAAQAQAQAQVQAGNDKQRKLEECFKSASTSAANYRQSEFGRAGCLSSNGVGLRPMESLPPSVVDACLIIGQAARDGQTRDESRCVQLYR